MKKFIVAIAALAMLTGSAYAADWNFYGSSRISTFYVEDETIDVANSDTENYEQALQGNARIGATVKVSDELTGGFEYGTGVNVRKLYGEWNFGAGTFLVGQTYTPLNWFYSNQVFGTDNDLLAQGGLYSGREGMLRLKFGGFQVAVLAPNKSLDGVAASSTEVSFPGIEAAYSASFDAFTLDIAAGYQSFEINDNFDVDSYVLAVGGKVNLGAAYLNASVFIGENAGNMIAIDVDGTNDWDGGYAFFNGTEVLDNEAMGFLLVGGFTFNDMFAIEAGYGYIETELDNAPSEDEAASYYLQATITLAPGVFVTPEVGIIDGDEAGQNETTYFGAKWQINF